MRGLCALAVLVGAFLPMTCGFVEVSGHQEVEDESIILHFARKWAAPVGLKGRPLVILTFADFPYAQVLINWLAGMYKLGINNIGVICLDDALVELMESIHRPCFLPGNLSAKNASADQKHNASTRQPKLAPLWGERLHMLSTIVGGGIDVVMSDSDAFWQRNALPMLVQGDITVSRGSFPEDTAKRYGAAACMGLVYFAGIPRVESFLREHVIPIFLRTHDDQVALNHALSASGLTFSERLLYENSKEVVQGKVPSMNLTINFLDHQRFQRWCNPFTIKDSFVGHCLGHAATAKMSQAKAMMLSTFHMWLLGDKWRNAANVMELALSTGAETYEDFVGRVISEPGKKAGLLGGGRLALRRPPLR